MSSQPKPSSDELEDVLLSCRYGELPELQTFIETFGVGIFVEGVKDERGTTGLHYICGNGHQGAHPPWSNCAAPPLYCTAELTLPFLLIAELAEYLLPLLPSPAFSAQNTSGSTPLHWASLNGHLELAKLLVLAPASSGDKLIDIKNEAGYTAVGEAELAERSEIAMWLVGRMILNDKTSDPERSSNSVAAAPASTTVAEGGLGESKKADGSADDDDDEPEVPLFKLTLDEKGEVVGHESLIGEQQSIA